MDWEFGVNICKLLPLEWISNEILLYSTGNYVWSLMMEHDNVRKKNDFQTKRDFGKCDLKKMKK